MIKGMAIIATTYYNGMYINHNLANDDCYVTDDTGHFIGRFFVSYRAAQYAITKARKSGVPASR